MNRAIASILALAPLAGVLAAPAVAQTVVTLGTGFDGPAGIAVDTAHNVVFAEVAGNAVQALTAASGYKTVETLGSGFSRPGGVAFDTAGNVVVADTGNNAIKVLQSPAYTNIVPLGTGFILPTGVTVDGSNNVFVADTGNNAVKVITAASHYQTTTALGSGFSSPTAVAVDGSSNVFVADTGNNAVKEILAAGNYSTVRTLATGFNNPVGIAVDKSGNVYIADSGNNEVREIFASGGYTVIYPLGVGFLLPQGVAVDGSGNIFVGDTSNNAVREMPAAAPPVVASVLPGSRSVELGTAATVFASMINSGSGALANCQVLLPSTAPAGLTMSYQTTNPSTNALTGSPNTPVTIAGNDGLQTFLLAFHGSAAFSAPAMALDFVCASAGTAQVAEIEPGVDTLDLVMSSSPIADIIALAATPTNNSIIEVKNGGTNAFAVASSNVGAGASITVSVDTGAASLPLSLSMCETNPANAQCLSAPTQSVTLTIGAGSNPTFSVFASASGAIAFAPATSRIFVRFKDASGGLHGSTSVAVETD